MSLPSGGEVSAAFMPDASIEPFMVGQSTARFVATGEQTRGHLGLYRWGLVPQAKGASAHYHRGFAESFYVLTGAPEFYDGDRWIQAAPNDYLFVPELGVHGFRNLNDEPASMLILFTPGAPREAYFRELAEMVAPGRTPSREEWDDLYARHDQVMVEERR